MTLASTTTITPLQVIIEVTSFNARQIRKRRARELAALGSIAGYVLAGDYCGAFPAAC